MMDRIGKIAQHLGAPDGQNSCTKEAPVGRNFTNGGGLKSMEGKVAIVTGGASGIGEATAILFAENGAKVVCCDINAQGAQETADEINENFGKGTAIAVKCDVSSKVDVKNAVDKAVETFGRLDTFFANAGVLHKMVPIWEEDEDQFLKTLQINTFSAFLAIKYASEAMHKTAGRGSIICTASIAAIRADLTPLSYSASKGGLLSLVTSASDRLLLEGIRVNAIAPGGVATPLMFSVAQGLEDQGLHLKGFDIDRYPPIAPEDIAKVVTFLASDAAGSITGELIRCDGGMSNSMGSQPRPSKKKSSKK